VIHAKAVTLIKPYKSNIISCGLDNVVKILSN